MLKLFLFDRDGVIIKNKPYQIKKEKVQWLNGAIQSIKFLNKNKIKVVIVTNQSGVARGYFTENELKKFHRYLNSILFKFNAKIDKFFYCPYHPNGMIKKYKRNSQLRKPNNGMLIRALKRFKVTSNQSFMIGDQKSDFIAAKKTNISFEYKKKNNLFNQVKTIFKKCK